MPKFAHPFSDPLAGPDIVTFFPFKGHLMEVPPCFYGVIKVQPLSIITPSQYLYIFLSINLSTLTTETILVTFLIHFF
jgi:hypothetical protein